MTEHEAVAALERLGLSSYEAKVFIALQKLGAGGARDVAGITDVPRSQVYGAANRLEEYGLVDVQQADPIQYRPVAIEEAKAELRDRFQRDQSRAFDYIEAVHMQSPGREEREDLWTITGRRTIDNRILHLLREAEEAIVFGVRHRSLLGREIEELLLERADDGVRVVVLSRAESVRELFDGTKGVIVPDTSAHQTRERRSGRVLVVDDETVLLSVLGNDEDETRANETAIWSSGTGFAHVLIQLIESYAGAPDHSD